MERKNAEKMGSIGLIEDEIWPFDGRWGTKHNSSHRTAKNQAHKALPQPFPSLIRPEQIDGDKEC